MPNVPKQLEFDFMVEIRRKERDVDISKHMKYKIKISNTGKITVKFKKFGMWFYARYGLANWFGEIRKFPSKNSAQYWIDKQNVKPILSSLPKNSHQVPDLTSENFTKKLPVILEKSYTCPPKLEVKNLTRDDIHTTFNRPKLISHEEIENSLDEALESISNVEPFEDLAKKKFQTKNE